MVAKSCIARKVLTNMVHILSHQGSLSQNMPVTGMTNEWHLNKPKSKQCTISHHGDTFLPSLRRAYKCLCTVHCFSWASMRHLGPILILRSKLALHKTYFPMILPALVCLSNIDIGKISRLMSQNYSITRKEFYLVRWLWIWIFWWFM